MSPPKSGRCYNCGVDRCAPPDYCYGCKKYICNYCAELNVAGPHKVDEHISYKAKMRKSLDVIYNDICKLKVNIETMIYGLD